MQTLKGIWFSRHAPTEAQLEDAHGMGYEIVETEAGMVAGSVSIETEEQAMACVRELSARAEAAGAAAVFGVFPTPILHGMEGVCVALYAAWNVSRTPEGGKPTFCHKKWQKVGGWA